VIYNITTSGLDWKKTNTDNGQTAYVIAAWIKHRSKGGGASTPCPAKNSKRYEIA
jgi:hypothetical protein